MSTAIKLCHEQWSKRFTATNIIIFVRIGGFYEIFGEKGVSALERHGAVRMNDGSAHTGCPPSAVEKWKTWMEEDGYKVWMMRTGKNGSVLFHEWSSPNLADRRSWLSEEDKRSLVPGKV